MKKNIWSCLIAKIRGTNGSGWGNWQSLRGGTTVTDG